MDDDATVGVLRRQYGDEKSILQFGGVILNDDEISLADIGICAECTLDVLQPQPILATLMSYLGELEILSAADACQEGAQNDVDRMSHILREQLFTTNNLSEGTVYELLANMLEHLKDGEMTQAQKTCKELIEHLIYCIEDDDSFDLPVPLDKLRDLDELMNVAAYSDNAAAVTPVSLLAGSGGSNVSAPPSTPTTPVLSFDAISALIIVASSVAANVAEQLRAQRPGAGMSLDGV